MELYTHWYLKVISFIKRQFICSIKCLYMLFSSIFQLFVTVTVLLKLF